MEFKIVEVCGFVDHRGRVCGRGRGRQGAYLDEEFPMELKMKHEKFLLHCDNQSVIHLAKNVAYNSGPSTYKEGITGCGRKWMTGSLPL